MTCECSGRGWCEKRGAFIAGIHVRMCQQGKEHIVDKLYADLTPKPRIPKKTPLASSGNTRTKSKIGDYLATIFKEAYDVKPCDRCIKAMQELNSMSPDEVESKRDAIIEDIASRAQTNSPSLWQKLAVAVDQAIGLGQTEKRIGIHLDEAVKKERDNAS